MGEITKEKLNGIDTEALKQVMGQVSKDPSVGKVKFKVTTTWKGTRKGEIQKAGAGPVPSGVSSFRSWPWTSSSPWIL